MIRIRRYSVIIYALLFLVLLSTRFVNLGWGLPYPMHPDERNMVDAITKLRCDDPSSLFSGVIHNVPAFLSDARRVTRRAIPESIVLESRLLRLRSNRALSRSAPRTCSAICHDGFDR